MKIGLLCAMQSEIGQLLPRLHTTKETCLAKTTVFEGDIDGLPFAAAATGICKVNAAMTAQMLIDRFGVTHVLMVGVAGGMDPRLGIHALVFSRRLAQHDVDPQFLRHRPTPDAGWFPGDASLLTCCQALDAQGAFLYPAFFGDMVSGEQFIAEEGRQQIMDTWHPLCVDMESAAAAQVCFANGVPFLAIRAISDTQESGAAAFDINEVSAADAAAGAAHALLKELSKTHQ